MQRKRYEKDRVYPLPQEKEKLFKRFEEVKILYVRWVAYVRTDALAAFLASSLVLDGEVCHITISR